MQSRDESVHPWRVAGRLLLVFLPMAFVGTMLHEAGHIVVAKALGYSTTLHFDSMTWFLEDDVIGGPGNEQHSFWISMGGPLANMGLGLVGLIWLARLSRGEPVELRGRGLLAVLLALLWSRQVFNACVLAARACTGGDWSTSDEVRIASYLDWPASSISLVTAALAAMAIIRTVLHVTKPQRLPLVLYGTTGSIAGYVLWYLWVGPLLLP